jgi:hypothetical protein
MGLQLFLRINCKLGLLGQTLVNVPPEAPQFPTLAPQNLVITNTGVVVTVKLTCPTDPGESTVLRASPPQNSAIRACHNYRIIGVCPAPVGKRIFVRASTMVDGFESLPRQFQPRVPASA